MENQARLAVWAARSRHGAWSPSRCSRRRALLGADAGIDDAVQDVDRPVDDDEHRGDDESSGLERWVISSTDGADHHRANAGPAEDRLNKNSGREHPTDQ